MSIFCACCGSAVVIDREVPKACPLCGRRAWQPAPPSAGRYDASVSDERYLKTIGIRWTPRERID